MSLLFSRARKCGPSMLLAGAAAGFIVPVHAQTALSEAQAIERALGDSDFTGLGAAEREAARAGADTVSRFDNPEIGVSHSRLRGAAGDEDEWEVGVTQPIDLSGRRSALRAALRAEADATDADVDRRRQQRIAEVRRAYADCAVAGEQVTLANAFSARLREAERVVTDRTQVGDTAVYDLRRLRVEARAADAEAALAVGEQRAECTALARLTGVADARPSVRLGALANPAASAGTSTGRADLTALEARVLAATQTAIAARRARLPALRLGAAYQRREEGGLTSSGPAVTVGVTLPILNGGGAAIREAEARARARQSELALARRSAEAEIAEAAARARAATDAARIAANARDDAGRLGDIAETSYQSGEIAVAELVDAYRAARDAELSIVELTGRAIRAAIDLDLAQGGTVR